MATLGLRQQATESLSDLRPEYSKAGQGKPDEKLSARPGDAFRNLFRHGKLDPRHRDDLDAALDGLPLTEDRHALLGISAFQTIHLLGQVVEEILEPSDRRRLQAVGAS